MLERFRATLFELQVLRVQAPGLERSLAISSSTNDMPVVDAALVARTSPADCVVNLGRKSHRVHNYMGRVFRAYVS